MSNNFRGREGLEAWRNQYLSLGEYNIPKRQDSSEGSVASDREEDWDESQSFVEISDSSVAAEAREERPIEHLDTSQNLDLQSIKDKEFVPIDPQLVTIPTADMQFLESIGYRLGQKLGTGSFGEVFRCQFRDNFNNTIELAAKLILMKETLNQDELIESLTFIRCELISLSRAVHPHIVSIQNCVTSMRWNEDSPQNNSYYGYAILFMELADNTFENYIQIRSAISEEDTKEFLAQIVVGVGYLHSIGVAHRNVKPVNVLLFRNQNFRAGYFLKLCDFGTAHIFDPETEPNPQTDELIGNIMYRAPEMDEHHWSHDKRSYDPRLADIYSIGVILVQMLCGYRNTRGLQLTTGKRYHRKKFLDLMRRLGKSEDSIDLVDNMVKYEAQQRYTIAAVLQHRFLLHPVLQESWIR
jgi:serine/threonine protein kinase